MDVRTRSRAVSRRRRNDPAQYDDLAGEWWKPRGAFAALHWLAEARGALVPPAERPGAVLVDLGCGAGLLAPHVAGKGYRHIGVDLGAAGLVDAARHGVAAVRGDVLHVPLADECADVVTAGEILEHVPDLSQAVAEACRLLRPGGLLVIDTIAPTVAARVLMVTVGERVPGGPPPGCHDPDLFVDPDRLARECAAHGVNLRLRGITPHGLDVVRWLAGRTDHVRMRPTRNTSVLYQAVGRRR